MILIIIVVLTLAFLVFMGWLGENPQVVRAILERITYPFGMSEEDRLIHNFLDNLKDGGDRPTPANPEGGKRETFAEMMHRQFPDTYPTVESAKTL